MTYWKPEPKRHEFAWYALLIPALVYSLGVVIYAREAFVPGLDAVAGLGLGSALMVIGGEAGTLAAAAEVFRKSQVRTGALRRWLWWSVPASEANLLDWFGLLVSLIATLGNLFVVYVSLTQLGAAWVGWVREFGPLLLLLCSGVDFYAGLMEFGFYNASFEARWQAWNDARHTWEQAQRSRASGATVVRPAVEVAPLAEIGAGVVREVAPVPAEVPLVAPVAPAALVVYANLREFRATWPQLNGTGDDLARRLAQSRNKAETLAQWLREQGAEPPRAEATLRHWAQAFQAWKV